MQVRELFRCILYHAHQRAALADADPLGVNPNVTFDEVGGLDDRKQGLTSHSFFLIPL